MNSAFSAFSAIPQPALGETPGAGVIPGAITLDKQRIGVGNVVHDIVLGQGVIHQLMTAHIEAHFQSNGQTVRVIYDHHGMVASKRRLFVHPPATFSFKTDDDRARLIAIAAALGIRQESIT